MVKKSLAYLCNHSSYLTSPFSFRRVECIFAIRSGICMYICTYVCVRVCTIHMYMDTHVYMASRGHSSYLTSPFSFRRFECIFAIRSGTCMYTCMCECVRVCTIHMYMDIHEDHSSCLTSPFSFRRVECIFTIRSGICMYVCMCACLYYTYVYGYTCVYGLQRP